MTAVTTEPPAPPRQRNILLVLARDDEATALRTGLDDMGPKWALTGLSDFDDASEAMEDNAFDAVLVDLSAQTDDGAALLREFMERSPETLRLGLIAASERPAIHRLDVPAQQFLTKPCGPMVLKAVLARAFASQDCLSNDCFRELLSGINTLPVLPATYTEIMKELASSDPSLERAGQIVARDLGLSTNVLKLVNSALFGLGRAIAHPSEAAMFLGSETLKALVLSLQVFSQFNQLKLKEFSVEALWKHSWITGVLARRLCEFEEADRATTDAAFIAGLLHDAGKLVLATNHAERFQEIIRLAQKTKSPLWEQEHRAYQTSHAELGGYLLGQWGLPPAVVEAVAFHHRPAQSRCQKFSALTAVHVANTLGQAKGTDSKLVTQSIDTDYLRGLGLSGRVEGWRQFFAESLGQGS